MIEALTFDVTHTLIHSPRVGEIYSEVLGRHGIAVEPGEARRLISVVWQELACSAHPKRDRWSAHPEGARGWWMRFLARFCEHLGVPTPSRFVAAELFHTFAAAPAWEVYPEVPRVLDELRGRGLRLGVISNWDHRLPALLRELNLGPRLEVIVFSSQVGVEKPDPRIFRHALEVLAVEPAAVVHVGDSQLEDVEGATAVGMQALLCLRHGPPREPAAGGQVLRDLSPLPELVASGALTTHAGRGSS